MRIAGLVCGAALAACVGGSAWAQPHDASKVEIAFNRYYDYEEIAGHLRALASAYPDLIELRSIGKSLEGRDMWLVILTSPDVRKGTEDHAGKPAMWIDGSIHANEIQASEVVLYSIWYLAKGYGKNEEITALLDRTTFYMLPVLNADSRAYWFREASTPNFPRANQRPVDSDRDGRIDEDPFDDLDGDGSITSMWKRDPGGAFVRDRFDPRIFRRVPEGERGEWTPLGSEGVDNDGDGSINEDGPGGDDMNRNWPSDWKPNYVQFGAGPYPLSHPETRSIAAWVLDHPNIAAFQSYHNTGGMILRGPGTDYREADYPRADRAVYDALGEEGVKLLPFYRYLVIYKDLYNVHGGEVNWAAEGLGIVSFTNELFTAEKYFMRDGRPSEEDMLLFRDRLDFGATFKDYTEVEHPEHGAVLVGGPNKWSSRSTPTFMLEDECHRNFAFTMFHAGEMPELAWGRVRTERLAGNPVLWALDVEVRNERIIPTRTARAASKNIGVADLLVCEPAGGRVVASGALARWWDTAMNEVRHEPARVLLREGVPGRGSVMHRFIVEGPEGAAVKLTYTAEKAADVTTTVRLGESRGE